MTFAPQSMGAALSGAAAAAAGAMDLTHLCWSDETKEMVRVALASGRIPLVRQALKQLESHPQRQQFPEFKLAVLRSFTIEPQLDFVSLSLSTIPSRPTLKVGDFANFETLLWNPASDILAFAPHAVLVLWRLEDLYPDLIESCASWPSEKREQAANMVVERINALCNGYCKVSSAPIFISTMPDIAEHQLSDLHRPWSLKSIKSFINQKICELAGANPQVRVFDFGGWCAREGKHCFDERMDFFAKQPISAVSIASFAADLSRTFRPLLQPRAKVVVVDLDNTLWGGTLGEDGPSGLKLGRDYPGNVYRQIQISLRQLKDKGILLALASKNDLDRVKDAFEKLSEMVLKWDDFVCAKVDWNPKHANIKAIAEQLNLGLDSFVFLDDNHLEREEIRHYYPQVHVLQVSDEPISILRALKTCTAFDTYALSEEDEKRSELYALQAARSIDASVSNVEEFLHSLEMKAIVEPVTGSTLPRAVQMLQKTNQFNVTTRRHTESVLREWMKSERNILLTLELEDRFGSQGIVGLIMGVEHEPDCLSVDSFLMSCRVIGRGVEDSLWSCFVNKANSCGFEKIVAEYLKTEKNNMVSDLFDKLGMSRTKASETEISYNLALPAVTNHPAWIQIKVKDNEQSTTAV